MDKDRELEILGAPEGWTPETGVDHFMVCPGCGALIDCRDLGMVMDHACELPHKADMTLSS